MTVRDPDKPPPPDALRTPDLHDFSDLGGNHGYLTGSLAVGVVIALALLAWHVSPHPLGAAPDAVASRPDVLVVTR
ncbi:hypothetical protein [Rhodopila sp.]|uniref:hypothetical protein n=1 Tax=Rhodopila sp. TaxID=2480087 RepID=UPI002C62CD29|nr:hypothetical protein [Rhodopila sp.]HVZ08185.1 hypothetical protein [Rhodopila sp.]